ncbi:Hsp70 family protein [Rhodococcus sp. G-MC3]|uniref:Hsp70 family protein n=1 Tax=Rhodococcus sp. G-MC3 TaxID=3046209 RepID=UPI0024BAAC88|nr:Hsp70 family protein [Rhodococcus sp. G-MC3]MDJ0395607.1 Hsp70 family protein [Rhodococcus sp. G-MC3]
MSAVLGASLGVGGIRAVSLDLSVDPPLSTDSSARIPDSADDPWGSVTSAVHRLAREQNAESGPPVLALRDKNPIESYGVERSDGLVLVSDLGAQIGALQEAGDITCEQTVALFDVGAGGVTMSIVDVGTGSVHSSRRSTVLSGDGCDAALSTFLLENHGLRPRLDHDELDHDALDLMVERVCSAKETLSSLTAVDIHGPFHTGNVVLHRSELDALIRDAVFDAVTMAAAMIDAAPRVDALYAVGGGANMQIVRQSLLDALTVPVFVPHEPEMLATRGAAGMARRYAATEAVGTAAGRPRHSDTSSRRLTRLRSSRYLGGAVAILVAGGVALSLAAASSRQDDPEVEYTQVITSSPVMPSASGGEMSVPPVESEDVGAAETTTTISDATTERTKIARTTPPEGLADTGRRRTTTVMDPSPTTVTEASPTTVTEASPTTVTEASPTTVTAPSPTTVTVAPPAPPTSTKVSTATSPTRTTSPAPTTRRPRQQ